MKRYAFLAVLLCASLLRAQADMTQKKRELEENFRRVPIPELGPAAAQLVRSTPAPEREQIAVAAVETILERHPAAALSVVAAISKAAPETSPAVRAAANRVAPFTSSLIPSRQNFGGVPKKDDDDGDRGNSVGGNSGRGGEVHHDGQLPNGKPFPPIQSHRPPHPEHPEHPTHPPHPPHPIKYNQPHDHDHDGDDDGHGHGRGRDEHGHGGGHSDDD